MGDEIGTQGSGCTSIGGGILSGFCSLDCVAYSQCFLLSTIGTSLPNHQLTDLLGLVCSGNDREAEGSGKIASEDLYCVFNVVFQCGGCTRGSNTHPPPKFWCLRLKDRSRAGRSCRECEASWVACRYLDAKSRIIIASAADLLGLPQIDVTGCVYGLIV